MSLHLFESSVNSYDSQTVNSLKYNWQSFESSVNSYDSQTIFFVYFCTVLV